MLRFVLNKMEMLWFKEFSAFCFGEFTTYGLTLFI